jgi:hypothetical protein
MSYTYCSSNIEVLYANFGKATRALVKNRIVFEPESRQFGEENVGEKIVQIGVVGQIVNEHFYHPMTAQEHCTGGCKTHRAEGLVGSPTKFAILPTRYFAHHEVNHFKIIFIR